MLPGRTDETSSIFQGITVENAVRALLAYMGDDPTREGLRDTPKRVMKMLRELSHLEPFTFTTFDSEGMSQMIVQASIPLQSLCEHHMLPFVGTATVGYIPNGKIVGLSKLARTVHYCSRGLQNQERITQSIAQMLEENLNPKGIGVVISARHLCMEMRGPRVAGVPTVTSDLRGVMLDEDRTRAEFLSQVR